MKDVHRHLLFEMMSNSRRSDRELARALHTSQPTITRARRWLETNGYVLEYTLIPHFGKAGFELVAFCFIKLHINGSRGRPEDARNRLQAFFGSHPNVVLSCRGEGMGCDGIVMSFHKSYVEFTGYLRELKTEAEDIEVVGSFLASLDELNKLRCLTLKCLKDYAGRNWAE